MNYTVVGTVLVDRRRSRRMLKPPLKVIIDRTEYSALNWGLGGILIGSYAGSLAVGEEVPVTLIATVGGTERRHEVVGEVCRRDYLACELAIEFERTDPAMVETFERAFMERYRPRH